MKFNALAQKAARGSAPAFKGGALEVEHLIIFALAHGEEGAAEIERLSALHGWLDDGLLPDGSRVVPFGRWARACAAFSRGGVPAVQPLLAEPAMAGIAIGVLESVRSVDAVEALLAFGEDSDWRCDDPTHPAWKAVSGLNLLLSFDDGVQVPETARQRLHRILVRAWNDAPTDQLRSLCLYALRGATTPEALAWAQALVLHAPTLIAARKMAVKTIKRRLDPTYTAPNAMQKWQIKRARNSAT
ncbi:MAG: hypothetical protein ACN6RA_06180 [Stenotrophomonas maltophilia]|jgi:hypothetical protein